MPAKDEVLIALATYAFDYTETHNEIFDAVASARLALQTNLDIENRAREEEAAARGMKSGKTMSNRLPDFALLAQQSTAPSSQTETIANRQMQEMYRNHQELSVVVEEEAASPYQAFWNARHNLSAPMTETDPLSAPKTKRPSISLINREQVDVKVQYALEVLANKIAKAKDIAVSDVTKLDASRFMAEVLKRAVHGIDISSTPLYKGKITRPNGQLRPSALDLAQVIDHMPEDAFPDVSFVESDASRKLRTGNNQSACTSGTTPIVH